MILTLTATSNYRLVHLLEFKGYSELCDEFEAFSSNLPGKAVRSLCFLRDETCTECQREGRYYVFPICRVIVIPIAQSIFTGKLGHLELLI